MSTYSTGYGHIGGPSGSSGSTSSGSSAGSYLSGIRATKTLQAISGPMGTKGHCSECKGFTLIGNSTGTRRICSNCGHIESTVICPECGKAWSEGVVECYNCHAAILDDELKPAHKIEHKVVSIQISRATKNSVTIEEIAKLEKLLDDGFEILRSDTVQEANSTYARVIYILKKATITYEAQEPEELPSRSMEL